MWNFNITLPVCSFPGSTQLYRFTTGRLTNALVSLRRTFSRKSSSSAKRLRQEWDWERERERERVGGGGGGSGVTRDELENELAGRSTLNQRHRCADLPSSWRLTSTRTHSLPRTLVFRGFTSHQLGLSSLTLGHSLTGVSWSGGHMLSASHPTGVRHGMRFHHYFHKYW